MPGWDALLARLASGPRENGSAALDEAARFLEAALAEGGAEVSSVAFRAEPYGLRLTGVVILVGGLVYARLVRAGRWRPALATACAVPLVLWLQLDHHLSLLGWVGATTQRHVVARIPVQAPVQRLVFTAHYDTKTDLLDHVWRAPVDLLAGPVAVLLVAGAAALALAGRVPRRASALRRLARTAAALAVAYGLAAFVALSAGAFLPSRSPGALDDGASCALLVRLAAELAAVPPERTEVEVVLLSAEEVGVQGSWRYAAERFAEPPALPTWVVNLEGLGASARHAVLRRERFTLHAYPPDPALRARVDAVSRRILGAPVDLTFYGGATDARAFLAHGVPALTLVSHAPGARVPRHLHSPRDDRSRVDASALDASLALLLGLARDVDRDPL